MIKNTYSVRSVHKALLETLHQYLSATYHIWDEWLISERDRILREEGNTYQVPRLEATPQYMAGNPYSELQIPAETKAILNCAASDPSTGIPTIAYSHQCLAIENFNNGRDLIVATGTGSGKTESFLMPILSSLAVEAKQRQKCWERHGARAILLYPMNALVNDQLSRLRRLLGNASVRDALKGSNKRGPTFGMYTSRSPYPGERSASKDKSRVEGEIRKLYFDGMTEEYRNRLRADGKWPAKDLEEFLSSHLKTGQSDVELLTRHEMHEHAPDLLVTNYSMLEYMMLRPLEAPIFKQTADWLASDERNQLIIVIDEAHMYRGSGGAEVAYLLRRLQSRLDIPRNRIRYILTSASLGSSENAKVEIKDFAAKLTGGAPSAFELVTGNLDRRRNGKPANASVQQALAEFDFSLILSASTDPGKGRTALTSLAESLQIQLQEPLQDTQSLQQYAYALLERLPVASLVADQLMSAPTTLMACAELAFPVELGRERAAEALLALMAFAKDKQKNRPFCPIRSHLFFRGLPGLFACTNIECGGPAQHGQRILGRLHAVESLQCDCGARVYELLTHRSCGATFLRAYMQELDGDFLWHQSSNGTWTDTELTEAQFYVVPESEIGTARGRVIWLHTLTGRLLLDRPKDAKVGHYLALLRPDWRAKEHGRFVWSFRGDCPACGQRTRPDAPLAMDLATKGEAPFAHIIRTQVSTQPASRVPTAQAPNGGRKTIVFSDGRQKAARLARDIPREIELDVFRQVLFISAHALLDIGKQPRLNKDMYVSFLKCLRDRRLRFFDGNDRDHIEKDIQNFGHFYGDNDLESALEDDTFTPPSSYWAILLQQLGTPFYSVSALTLGYAAPIGKPARAKILSELSDWAPEDLDAISIAWVQRLLTRYAFGRDLGDGVRSQASRYPLKPSSATDGFSKLQHSFLTSKGRDAKRIAACLAKNLCDEKADGSIYLRPSHLILRPALNNKWVQCSDCKTVSPALIFGHCPNCGKPNATLVDPATTSYLRARKGFWRDPVARAVAGTLQPVSIDVQEHSAQLSYKDADNPSPTTEIFERQFRDILRDGERAVDVLSCTTTMEVGIDIGSLIAVSMRNVPPMRQNYQQRAGRAGRRGSAVSTVVTYAQSGAHDAYYFRNPDKILAGDPPKPVLDTSNTRIAERHVLAQLLQDFFHKLAVNKSSPNIFTVLGDTWTFFSADIPASFAAFKRWIRESDDGRKSLKRAQQWLPEGMQAEAVAELMVKELEQKAPSSQEGLDSGLLDFLFARGLLPSYAFPTDICSFQIQERTPGGHGGFRVLEQAQQGLNVALSEYAPGRLVVVNKKTYRIGTVAASGPDSEVDRAAALFEQGKVFRHCTQCSYTAGFISGYDAETTCPQCGSNSLQTMTVIRPETVFPSGRKDIDEFEDQVFSRVTQAQLPLAEEDRKLEAEPFGTRGGLKPRDKQRLIVVNEGDPDAEAPGFRICRKCGKVLAEDQSEGPHYRDYFIRHTGAQIPAQCDGEFQRVLLGYSFTSDILLFRIHLAKPLRFEVVARRDRKPLEDALQTLCEALTLSIGRVLDIDTREVSAGYRLGNDGASDFADIFIYDTLSGGAGYALQAGESFKEIFQRSKELLANCSCGSSCENCLRHYGNRFNHMNLDRNLGIDLATYIEFGEVPAKFSVPRQREVLAPLIEMIKLTGWDWSEKESSVRVTHHGKTFSLAACPSLRACDAVVVAGGITTVTFTPYELARDLPSAFAEMK